MPGHLERDLLSGARNSHIANLVERQSRYVVLVKLAGKDSNSVINALVRGVKKLPDGLMELVNELANYFNPRPSFVWAKNELASFRISLARRSSLTSFFYSDLTRSCLALATAERDTVSTSCRGTYSFSVSGTQPIFGAIDSVAAHNDGYPHGVLAPYERRAYAPQAKICFAPSWLHSFRRWGFHKFRSCSLT